MWKYGVREGNVDCFSTVVMICFKYDACPHRLEVRPKILCNKGKFRCCLWLYWIKYHKKSAFPPVMLALTFDIHYFFSSSSQGNSMMTNFSELVSSQYSYESFFPDKMLIIKGPEAVTSKNLLSIHCERKFLTLHTLQA